MEESLQLANKLETLAVATQHNKDWDNARKAIDLAWSIYQRQKNQQTIEVEDDVEFARRMV